jgi:type VI protein secretion system component VasK
MFDTSYATWALVTLLWILRSLSVNVVRVANEHEGEEKKRVATKIAELEAANRKAEKALERMRREKANDDMMKMLSPTPRAI